MKPKKIGIIIVVVIAIFILANVPFWMNPELITEITPEGTIQQESIQSKTTQQEPKPTSKLPILDSEIITCQENENANLVEIKGSITNNDSEQHSPEFIIYTRDSNDNILTFVEHIEFDVAPGQTVYFSRLVDSHPSLVGCGLKLDRLN